MKTQSDERPDEFVRMKDWVGVSWDISEEVVPETDDCPERIQYSYYFAKVKLSCSREDFIEALMKAKYPSYGAEIAAIRNGGDDAIQHQMFRDVVKEIADRFTTWRMSL